jgi:hypothetical protein
MAPGHYAGVYFQVLLITLPGQVSNLVYYLLNYFYTNTPLFTLTTSIICFKINNGCTPLIQQS